MASRRPCALLAAAGAGCGLAALVIRGPEPRPAAEVLGWTVESDVRVERPPGQLVLEEVTVGDDGRLRVTVVDTRGEDPGWTVSVTATGGTVAPDTAVPTLVIASGDGRSYGQRVRANLAGPGWAAEAGAGLGIARLGASVSGTPKLSVTVI